MVMHTCPAYAKRTHLLYVWLMGMGLMASPIAVTFPGPQQWFPVFRHPLDWIRAKLLPTRQTQETNNYVKHPSDQQIETPTIR